MLIIIGSESETMPDSAVKQKCINSIVAPTNFKI